MSSCRRPSILLLRVSFSVALAGQAPAPTLPSLCRRVAAPSVRISNLRGGVSGEGSMMAACRGAVQIAPDLGSRAARIPVLSSNGSVAMAQRTRTLRNCNHQSARCGSRAKKTVVRAIVDVATESSSAVSEDESLRRAESYFATDSRPIVLFDGVCNFCNAGVNFLLDNDPEGRVRMAALQSEAGKALLLRAGRSSNDISSLVLVEKDRSYVKSEGVLRTAQYLGNLLLPMGSLGLLFPLFFRDFVYDNVANNRYSILGRRDQCRVSDPRFNDRFVV